MIILKLFTYLEARTLIHPLPRIHRPISVQIGTEVAVAACTGVPLVYLALGLWLLPGMLWAQSAEKENEFTMSMQIRPRAEYRNGAPVSYTHLLLIMQPGCTVPTAGMPLVTIAMSLMRI